MTFYHLVQPKSDPQVPPSYDTVAESGGGNSALATGVILLLGGGIEIFFLFVAIRCFGYLNDKANSLRKTRSLSVLAAYVQGLRPANRNGQTQLPAPAAGQQTAENIIQPLEVIVEAKTAVSDAAGPQASTPTTSDPNPTSIAPSRKHSATSEPAPDQKADGDHRLKIWTLPSGPALQHLTFSSEQTVSVDQPIEIYIPPSCVSEWSFGDCESMTTCSDTSSSWSPSPEG